MIDEETRVAKQLELQTDALANYNHAIILCRFIKHMSSGCGHCPFFISDGDCGRYDLDKVAGIKNAMDKTEAMERVNGERQPT